MTATAILRLQRAGFTEEQVEALAEFSETGTATKSDINRLEAAIVGLDRKIDILDGRVGTLENRVVALESRVAALESRVAALEQAIERVRHELEVKFAEGKAETIKWVFGVGFAQVAMILAVPRLFPGVHS